MLLLLIFENTGIGFIMQCHILYRAVWNMYKHGYKTKFFKLREDSFLIFVNAGDYKLLVGRSNRNAIGLSEKFFSVNVQAHKQLEYFFKQIFDNALCWLTYQFVFYIKTIKKLIKCLNNYANIEKWTIKVNIFVTMYFFYF